MSYTVKSEGKANIILTHIWILNNALMNIFVPARVVFILGFLIVHLYFILFFFFFGQAPRLS